MNKSNQLKQIFAVAAFTFRDAVRKKSFMVTNIIYIVVILGACVLLPRLGGGGMDVTALTEGVAVTESRSSAYAGYGMDCYLLNGSAGLQEAAGLLSSQLMLSVKPVAPGGREAALAAVRAGSNAALVEITDGEPPHVTITTKDLFSAFPVEAVWQSLTKAWQVNEFTALGYDIEQSASIVGAALPLSTGMADSQGMSNYIAGMALMLLMFMTIYVYGYGVAMSVATEKSTRVMETLIVSAKPPRILLGKCIGMGLVGLAQLVGVLLLAAGSSKVFIPGGTFGGGLGLPDLTLGKALLLVAYFLMGYALFSMINSMCGAMVSKMEDLQSAMMPAALISVFSFYGGYVTVGIAPAAGGGTAASYITMLIPFTAPYAAPSALLAGGVPPTILAASIGILLATIALVSFVSGRVYSASVLHYGGRLRFADVKRMVRGK